MGANFSTTSTRFCILLKVLTSAFVRCYQVPACLSKLYLQKHSYMGHNHLRTYADSVEIRHQKRHEFQVDVM